MSKTTLNRLMAKKGRGFTLVEILVVILIIGLLFVFLVPKISSSTDKAREVGLKTDFHSYEVAFESVMKEKSGLGENAGLADEQAVVTAVNEYLDPALQVTYDTAGSTTAKKDPWNNKYKFIASPEADSNNGAIAVISGGKDSTIETTSIATIDPAAANLGQTPTGDDKLLICAYNDGTEYTATVGFSTNINAN